MLLNTYLALQLLSFLDNAALFELISFLLVGHNFEWAACIFMALITMMIFLIQYRSQTHTFVSTRLREFRL